MSNKKIPTIHQFKLTKKEQNLVKSGSSALEIANIPFYTRKKFNKIPNIRFIYYEDCGILDVYVNSEVGMETEAIFKQYYL
jgi:hypothetical protein